MKPTSKQSTCMIDYNDTFDSYSDKHVEFIYIDLSCNKRSVWLLANDSVTHTKKRRVVEIEDEADEPPKTQSTREKRIPVKQVGKKSSKTSVLISEFIGKPLSDIQALLMNTNIVITALHLFQISPKFREKTSCLMTVPQKPLRRRLCPLLYTLLFRLLKKKKSFMQKSITLTRIPLILIMHFFKRLNKSWLKFFSQKEKLSA